MDLQMVDGVLCNMFQEAATALRLFANEREAEYAMKKVVESLKNPLTTSSSFCPFTG